MINKLLLCATVLVAGCTTVVPVKQKFPEVPQILMEKCEPLSTIDKTSVVFSEFLSTVAVNYTKYHTCAAVVSAWQDWYRDQKKISDDLNK